MITLTKFRSYPSMSEETLAFNATVLWNGKVIGYAKNGGVGAEGDFSSHIKADPVLIAEAEAWAKTQTMDLGAEYGTVSYTGIGDYCDFVAGELDFQRRETAWLKRSLKTKSILVFEGKMLVSKAAYTPAVGEKLLKSHPGAIILNAIPFPEAEKLHMDWVLKKMEGDTAPSSPTA